MTAVWRSAWSAPGGPAALSDSRSASVILRGMAQLASPWLETTTRGGPVLGARVVGTGVGTWPVGSEVATTDGVDIPPLSVCVTVSSDCAVGAIM
ncbi:hypothetical protein GCM10009557_29830 [Virgisporangium ochraceum]